MKKQLLLAFFSTIVLFTSCSKESTVKPEKDETLYPVSFNISTFKSEIVPMAKSNRPYEKITGRSAQGGGNHIQAAGMGNDWLGNKIENLNCYVLDELGNVVKSTNYWRFESILGADGMYYNSPNEGFGIIEDSLPNGNYTILFTTNGSTFWGTKNSGQINIDSYGDTFVKVLEFIVSDGPIEQSILLDRVAGKVEIDLLDEVPADVDNITITISNIATTYYPFLGTYGSNSQKTERSINTTSPDYNEDISIYFGVQDNSAAFPVRANVNVRAYGKEGNLIVNKIINDVPVGVNKKTVLTGRLFDESVAGKGQNFSVALQDQWLNTDNISF